MALETHRGLHSALFSPVPGGLAARLKSASGALPLCTLQSPQHRRSPGATTKPALGRVSLSSSPWPPGWWPTCMVSLLAGPISSRLPACRAVTQALVFGFSLRCSLSSLPWLTSSCHLPHPESGASAPCPDLTRGWMDLGPPLSGKTNLTRDLASFCPSLYSCSTFILSQERAASKRGGTEGKEGTPCHQTTKGQGIPECQPYTKHAAKD